MLCSIFCHVNPIDRKLEVNQCIFLFRISENIRRYTISQLLIKIGGNLDDCKLWHIRLTLNELHGQIEKQFFFLFFIQNYVEREFYAPIRGFNSTKQRNLSRCRLKESRRFCLVLIYCRWSWIDDSRNDWKVTERNDL